MRINVSKATFSSIVGIGQKVKKAALESGNEYLELNRGVNSVVGIDLTEVQKLMDFNTKEFQLYAPNLGIESLSITEKYTMKVGDKVVCKKMYFAMNSKGVAYFYKDSLYEVTFSNHLGVNIKDDKGLELWFGYSGHCSFYEYFLTLAEYREKRIDEILE